MIFGSVLIAAALAYVNCLLALPFFLFSLFSIYFFRDPDRKQEREGDYLISPADGKVLEVLDDVESPIEGDTKRLKKLSIFMSIFSVHVNRAPCSGKVSSIVYKAGKFFPADKAQASLENESNTLTIYDANGDRFIVVQIAGIVARRIKCWVTPGDEVQKGQRFGIIRYGSRVELFVSKDFSFRVEKGQKLKAGETIIGEKTKKKD